MTEGTQYRVLKCLLAVPRKGRRCLEIGFGLGYVVSGLLSCGITRVMAIELRKNSGTLKDAMQPHPSVALKDGDVLHMSVETFIDSRFTTVSCLVGTEDVTRHVTSMFLQSPYALELCYLLPSLCAVARDVGERLGQSCLLRTVPVQFGRGGGRRSVVIATKQVSTI